MRHANGMSGSLPQTLTLLSNHSARNPGSDDSEELALGIDPKSLHATVLMQTVYNAVVQHSGGFLKHVAISVTEKGRIMLKIM